MHKLYVWNKEVPSTAESLGLSHSALSRIFLGPEDAPPAPEMLPGMPPVQLRYAQEEFRAISVVDEAFNVGSLILPDPWTEKTTEAMFVVTTSNRGSLPFENLPLCYKFQAADGRVFWAIFYGLYGRVSCLYIPGQECLIYRTGEKAALAVVDFIVSLIEATDKLEAVVSDRVTVGLLDMVTNFGHQLINHLSGVQRLIDFGLLDRCDEIWLCGTEFLGPTEAIFPEFRGRFRRFNNRWDIHTELMKTPRARLFKIGSIHYPNTLRANLLQQNSVGVAPGKPTLAVTVRSSDRRCLNLPQAVAAIYNKLAPDFPDLRIIIDGWVFSDSDVIAGSSLATAISPRFLKRIAAEMAEAQAIYDALPPDVVVDNVIGLSMRESVSRLQGISAYFSHVGTLQHKLGFLTFASGVVHGPRHQLVSPEGGSFVPESGGSVEFLPPDAVTDVLNDTTRGPGAFDYNIDDINAAVSAIRAILTAN